MPFEFEQRETEPPGGGGPKVRTDVDIGAPVLDLAAMRAQLEADRDRRQGR